MAGEGERAQTARREQVVGLERERLLEHALGLDVVGGIAGLPRTLLVREPEQRQRLHVARILPHGVLQLDDEALRVAERESRERVVRRHGGGLVPACVDGRGRRVAAQHPAEEAADAEQSGDSCNRSDFLGCHGSP